MCEVWYAALGQTVSAGEVFCYLAEAAEWAAGRSWRKQVSAEASAPGSGAPLPAGLRITQPALALAQQAGLDLSQLPAGPLVTEKMVKELVDKESLTPARDLSRPSAEAEVDPTALVIYGGGGHGKALIDLLRTLGTYHLVGVVDDGFPAGTAVMGLPVLGGREALADLYARGVRLAVNAVGGIGNVAVRIQVFQILAQAGFTCPAVVHPTAWVEPSASLAAGVQVFPHAYVGSEAQVGFGAIVNTGAIVSHECVLGECVNIITRGDAGGQGAGGRRGADRHGRDRQPASPDRRWGTRGQQRHRQGRCAAQGYRPRGRGVPMRWILDTGLWKPGWKS